jgi:transcriptional regulator with XRE-family HTH domain
MSPTRPATKNIADLLTHGEQPWSALDDDTYNALAEEIKANDGHLVVPVVISATGRLIDGHHRLMILQSLGRRTITLGEWVVDSHAVDPETEALAAINYQRNRRQTTSADNARVARDLMRRFHWSQGVVAKKLGVSAAAVSQWFKANPDPDFAQTTRVGADGKTYSVDDEEGPPAPKRMRDPAKNGTAVRSETRKYREQLTNPELAGWLVNMADPDDYGDLAISWAAIAEAAAHIAESFEHSSPDGRLPFPEA